MPGKDFLVDPTTLDFTKVVADIEEIRKYNPQREEFEQLTAVLIDDAEHGICVGYKDLAEDEFWARGHMPNFPLMPGVLMCEAGAQIASFHAMKHDLLGAPMVGLGGLEDFRFRGVVRPGQRLVVAGQLTRVRRGRMLVCRIQEFVNDQLVCEGVIKGIPLSSDLAAS